MHIDFLQNSFARWGNREAIIWQDQSVSYHGLFRSTVDHLRRLQEQCVAPGTVVSLEADFSPQAISLLLALIEQGCIVVPLTASVEAKKPEFRRIAQVQVIATLDSRDDLALQPTGVTADHVLLQQLAQARHSGLILFSSGSTGQSKAAVHDFVLFLEKYKTPREGKRTISFLLFDHIGGVNTLFHTLANGGCMITLQDRSPDGVALAIQQHRAQVLPTSPTFLNLFLLSEAYQRYDLSSVELVTYGTEVMGEATLQQFHQRFPHIRMLQTYGLSEVGILRSKSKASGSLWVKVGGEGFETRVVDGMLEIRAKSAMLGYLNAPSPFTEDGWLKTGDQVVVDGEYFRFLGRKSEIINVGGEKVYPSEVENVLQMMPGVEDVAVTSERNPITGQMVVARIKLNTGEEIGAFRKRMRAFCKDKLANYKIPQKVILADQWMHGGRFKKMRQATEPSSSAPNL